MNEPLHCDLTHFENHNRPKLLGSGRRWGNVVLARLRFAHITARFSAVGELRKSAEQVATECAKQVRRYLDDDAPVCEHLADQLLLPLALGAGGRFRTGEPSEHARTNAAIIARFLGEVVMFTREASGTWQVEVRGRDAAGSAASVEK